MPVDNRHPDYSASLHVWTRARDVSSGEDAVKAKREAYLPRLSGQTRRIETEPGIGAFDGLGAPETGDDYESYLRRAHFFNATGRTVDGLNGMIHRKAPTITATEALQALMLDIDMAGQTVTEFAKRATAEAIKTGRGGILVEYPRAEVREYNASELEGSGLRPYMTYWPAEAIINWRSSRINGRFQLSRVVLEECAETPDPADEFAMVKATRCRVYDLGESGVMVRIFARKGDDKEFAMVDSFPLIIRGEPMRGIPFVFVGAIDSTPEVQKSPIHDLVLSNLAHWRVSADYFNSMHWTGSPTPIFMGNFISTDGQPVTEVALGSTRGINLEAGGDAKMLQATMDDGLGNGLARLENYMAVLGARILAPEKRAAEAAETAAIHRAGENSVLASLADSCSKALTRALRIFADWANLAQDVVFELNKDYLPSDMSPQSIDAIVRAWQGNALSSQETFEAFKRGELVDAAKTFEEHEAEVAVDKARMDEGAMDDLVVAAGRQGQPLEDDDAEEDED